MIKDHLIVVGFGLNGRNVARAARLAGVPYLIIELNPETVRIEKKKGEPIYYGDAGQEAVLKHANIKEARIVLLTKQKAEKLTTCNCYRNPCSSAH